MYVTLEFPYSCVLQNVRLKFAFPLKSSFRSQGI